MDICARDKGERSKIFVFGSRFGSGKREKFSRLAEKV
jgi:hypothetical protein